MRRRSGSMLLEATLAITLLVAAYVGVAQLLFIASHQRRETLWRQTAIREAGNTMERVMRLPPSQLTSEAPPPIALSDEARQTLPAGQLRVQVTPESSQQDALRVTVEVDWQDGSGLRVQPVELVGWRFGRSSQAP